MNRLTFLQCLFVSYFVAFSTLCFATSIPDDRVKVELYSDGISLVHENKYFYGPYKVQSGDSFTSISQKFYKTDKNAAILSEINAKSPVAKLEPGTMVYVSSSSVVLLYGKSQEDKHYRQIKDYLTSIKKDSNLTYVWDEAEIDMELSHEGKWILNKYNSAKLRIFDPVAQKPELQIHFTKTPVLDIIFGANTHINNITIEK